MGKIWTIYHTIMSENIPTVIAISYFSLKIMMINRYKVKQKSRTKCGGHFIFQWHETFTSATYNYFYRVFGWHILIIIRHTFILFLCVWLAFKFFKDFWFLDLKKLQLLFKCILHLWASYNCENTIHCCNIEHVLSS